MQYRRFGQSDLVVSTVGFGTWTLASNWWGATDGIDAMLNTALECGVTFFDTAPVYGEDGFGETLLASFLNAHRDEVVLTTKCGYDIDAPRKFPGQSERPQDWRPEAVREQLEASLRRLGTDYIDLYQLHNVRIDAVHNDALWDELGKLRAEGKVRELGVALGPAIGWVQEGIDSLTDRSIVSLQTVFNILEQEPGLTFAAQPAVQENRAGLIARVPHASDVLSGKITRDTTFPPGDHRAHRNQENMLDNFDKADTLTFLYGGDTGRTIGQVAIAGILANEAFTTVLPTTLTTDDVREYAAAGDMALSTDEQDRLAALWSTNFGVTNRYEMPLKASK